MRRFDLIAFDWDGTLFDSTAIIARCIQNAVRDVGGTVPNAQTAAYVIGMGFGSALAHVAPDVPREKYPLLGQRYQHHYQLHQNDLSLFEGAIEMLNQLKKRQYRLAVATGKSRSGLDQVLSSLALHDIFDGSRCADQTAAKPDPKMLLELMSEFQLPAERTLMVGDTSHDLQMAHNAGCACVAVSYGAHDGADFQSWNPLFIAHSLAELQSWLLQYG